VESWWEKIQPGFPRKTDFTANPKNTPPKSTRLEMIWVGFFPAIDFTQFLKRILTPRPTQHGLSKAHCSIIVCQCR
jgi:hypothetical protein